MGSAPARVAVVVVSFNTRDELLRCLSSLVAVRLPLEVVVVDNASTDGSAEAARRAFPTARVIESSSNEGYAKANNRGWRATAAPFVLLLNSDTEVRPGAIEALVRSLEARPKVAIVGPRTLGSDGRVQVSSGPDLTPLEEWRQRTLVLGAKGGDPRALAQAEALFSRAHEPVWVSGSCLLIRRPALEQAGGLDEDFFLYEEDVDLCVRVARHGHRVLFEPRAEVVHHLGRSVAKDPTAARLHYHRSHLLYYRKHHGALRVALLRAYLCGLGIVAMAGFALGAPRATEARALLRLALRGR
jgi:N-acetylglucosaminyl-diphospho-decaprenol L-rhamnosyltransferase